MCGLTNYPIDHDPDQVIIGDCTLLRGGVKKPGAPEFVLGVENDPDPLWRDDDLTLVTEDNDDTIIVDNA